MAVDYVLFHHHLPLASKSPFNAMLEVQTKCKHIQLTKTLPILSYVTQTYPNLIKLIIKTISKHIQPKLTNNNPKQYKPSRFEYI
jgi:hypothetical protein